MKDVKVTQTRKSKIARLPYALRDQLNRRLQDGVPGRAILEWLNALPEVQAILAADFAGKPLTKQNLSDWRQTGFRDWLVRQDALEIASSLQEEQDLGDKALTGPFAEKLARWTTLQYASLARALPAESDSAIKWQLLHQLSADIARLRRAELYAEYLSLQRDWLAHEQQVAARKTDDQFWAWTKRPDIQQKLNPVKRGITPEIRREIEENLCLMEDPGPDIARAMRAKREAIEAAGITWDEYLAARNERFAATPAPATSTPPQEQPAPNPSENIPSATDDPGSPAEPDSATLSPSPNRPPAARLDETEAAAAAHPPRGQGRGEGDRDVRYPGRLEGNEEGSRPAEPHGDGE